MSVADRPVRALAMYFFVGVLSVLASQPVEASKQFNQIGSDGDVTIEVAADYTCMGPAPIRVNAPDRDWFATQTVRLQRLLGVARIALSFDCPKLDAIHVMGIVGNRQVFDGKASKLGGWVFRPTVVQAENSAASAPSQEARRPEPPREAASRETIQYPNQGALGGLWYGTASCGKGRSHRIKTAQVIIRQRKNGSYSGEAQIVGLRGGDMNLPFTASKGKLRRGVQTYQAKGKRVRYGKRSQELVSSIARVDQLNGQPRHIAVRITGRCQFISAARFVKIAGLAGRYADWTSPSSMCTGLKGWLDSVQPELKLAEEWQKQASDLVTGVKFDAAAKTSIFDDVVFRKVFGIGIDEIDPETYRDIVVQVAECATFRNWPDVKEFRKKISSYFTKGGGYSTLKGMIIPNETRVRDYHAGKLRLSPSVSELKALHNERRKSASKLGLVNEQFTKAKTIDELNTLSRNTLTNLASLPPSRLKPVLDFARAHRRTLQSKIEELAREPTEKLLAKYRKPFFTTDELDGHTLLAPTFGHAIYVDNAIVERKECPKRVPVRVQLGSLLPLKHYEKLTYGKQFFFYAMQALKSICGWPSKDNLGRGWKIRAHYFLGQDSVGQLDLWQDNYRIYAKAAEMKVNGWARESAHPNYIYDVVASTMLGGLTDRNGQAIRSLTEKDLVELSNAGDVHAAFHLAIKVKDKAFYSSGSAKVDLSVDLSYFPGGADENLLLTASSKGSASASHLLALGLALETGLIRSLPGAQDKSFEQLTREQQEQFVLWAAKAKHGRVYWSAFLDEAIDGWNIDMQPGYDAIAKHGLSATAPIAQKQSSIVDTIAVARSSETGEPVKTAPPVPSPEKTDWLRSALNDYHVRDCKLSAGMLTEQRFDLDGEWVATAQSCVFRPGKAVAQGEAKSPAGPEPQLTVGIKSVTHRECSGDDNEKTCDIAYLVGCNVSGSEPQLRQVCDDLTAFPISIFVNFERQEKDRWQVVGEVLRM